MTSMHNVNNMKKALRDKLKLSYGCSVEEASEAQMMRAAALVLREIMADREISTKRATREHQARQVHYLSMEFLMGRSLMKNAYNLGLGETLTKALDELGFRAADVFEAEPDAASAVSPPATSTPSPRWRSPPPVIPSAMSWAFSASASWTVSRWSCPITGRSWAARGS